MNQTAPSVDVSAPQSLKGKTLLFVSSGPARKRFVFQRARQLGVDIVLLNREANWAGRYAERVLAADTYDHEESLKAVEDYLKARPIDGAITFCEDDVPLTAKLCERFGWVGNSVEAALNARNKLRAREVLRAKGLESYSVPAALVRSAKELEKALKATGLPAVLKPAWGASSQFVVRVGDLEEAKNALEYIQANLTPRFDPIYRDGTEIIVEGFIDGAEVDVDLLLQHGRVKFHAVTDNFPTKEPFFIEAGAAMPSRHEESDLDEVLLMARETVRALGLSSGAVRLEAKITPAGPRVIEVNARLGGDYLWDWVRTAWDVDLIEESLKIAVGLPCEPVRLKEAKLHLVGRTIIPAASGVISRISLPERRGPAGGIHDVALLKETGDAVLVPPEGFDAIGWVAGEGHTYAEAEENLEEALRGLQVSIARFDSSSTIGKTRRRNRFSSASIARGRILQSAKLEKIRGADVRSLRELKIGVLCNRFDDAGRGESESATNEALVHQDLTSVGLNIQKALESQGHRVTFFDMNEAPLPFSRLAEADVDLVFNVCERINDSSLLEPHAAAMLDCLGVPYTGSNPLTLALCIDKIKVKKILEFHGIPTPKWDYVFDPKDPVREDLRYPLIVKPANTDNSIGITNDSVVTNPKALKERVEAILTGLKRPVLIEEFIEGDEVDVSVIGNEEALRVLPLSRSIFDGLPAGVWHIYPFKAKWGHDSVYSRIRTERPAKFSEKLTQLISEITLDVYNIFDCHDYARIEARVDKNGNPYILEVNPNPSINMGDCVPACAELIGLPYDRFIEEILKNAISRYQSRPPYHHLQSALLAL